jgi:hypothetical protein
MRGAFFRLFGSFLSWSTAASVRKHRGRWLCGLRSSLIAASFSPERAPRSPRFASPERPSMGWLFTNSRLDRGDQPAALHMAAMVFP